MAAAAAKSLQSCPTLCDPIDGSPPGSPVPGILQARTLEWVAISFSNAWEWKVKGKSLSWLSDHMDPMDCSLPWDFPGKNTGVGCHCLLHDMWHPKAKFDFQWTPWTPWTAAYHGIFQARILEWDAIAFSMICGTLRQSLIFICCLKKKKKIYLLIFLFLAMLGLHFCTGFSPVEVHGLLIVVASLVAEHGLRLYRLNSCGSRPGEPKLNGWATPIRLLALT